MKVLVVDDDKTTRKMISLILNSKGYEVVTAENGIEALTKVRYWRYKFDSYRYEYALYGWNRACQANKI